jgi:hypothetical protein
MPISSVSRVVETRDPIMETDLELLAKVNTYEQSKFDAGASALQNEVNNWAMMSQIAKPELREYANQKLNNLVNGINNLGGVNLSDINNVNSLKSLGYNIYADKRITDAVATTQNMRALQSDTRAKLSGKDAAKYDPAVSDYLMKGYNDWANDGNVDNTRYDGPTTLPQGNMNTINEKVKNYLKELKPDADSAPSGDLQKSYGYFQVEGKWLKGNRIEEAINAVTDENDALIFKSHGWKALGSDTDKGLIGKLGVIYDNTDSSIKNQINYLQGELNQTTDASRKLELSNLISQQKQALSTNASEKNNWFNRKSLTAQEREGIQESLYRNAWKSNVVNSYSYGQEKKEYKANMPLIFHDRMQIQAQQWAADYNLKVSALDLRKQELDLKAEALGLKYGSGAGLGGFGTSLNSMGGVPLTQEATKDKANQQKSPAEFMDNINAKYFGLSSGYYQYLYNAMGSNDTAGRFDNVNGLWKPKPQYSDQIKKEIDSFTTKIDNYSNLTDEERKNLNIPVGEDELKDLFMLRNQINTYGAYQKMAEDKETQIINSAVAKGTVKSDWRKVPVTINGKTATTDEVLALYKSGVYTDDTKIEKLNNSPLVSDETHFVAPLVNPFSDKPLKDKEYTVKDLLDSVNENRKKAEKSYEEVGGKMFNSYSVPLPFEGIAKPVKEMMRKQLLPKLGDVDVDSINPISGKIEFNFQTGLPEYKLEVQTGKAEKKKRVETIDVTDLVKESPNSGIGIYFPKSDVSLIWGLSLSDNGATPFSKQDNYKNALRTVGGNYPYQISTMTNALNGTTGLKVKVSLPVGDGTTVEVNVKNLQNGSFTFPASIEAVQQYLNDWLSTPELKERFYKEHGLTLSK